MIELTFTGIVGLLLIGWAVLDDWADTRKPDGW